MTQGIEHDLLVKNLFPSSFPECEYEIRTKPAKVVAWNSLPFGFTVTGGVMCLAEGCEMEKAK